MSHVPGHVDEVVIPEFDATGLDELAAQNQTADDPFVGPGGVEFGPDITGWLVGRPTTDAYANDQGPFDVVGYGTGHPGDSMRFSQPRRVERPGGEQAFQTNVPFKYRKTTPAIELYDMSPAEILLVQQQMIDAGLLSKPSGYADKDTIDAMTEVMGQANVTGTSWQQALTGMVSTNQAIQDAIGQGRPVRATPTFNFDPYLPPDYDTLVTEVEDLYRSHLGRDPLPHELTILADKMASLHRADYDTQYAAAKQKFEAQDFLDRQAALDEDLRSESGESGLGQPLVNPAETGPTQVDVAASILQAFQDRHARELESVEEVAQTAVNKDTTVRGLLGMNAFMAGNANEL